MNSNPNGMSPGALPYAEAGLLFGVFAALNVYFDTARWRLAVLWGLGASVYFSLAMAVALTQVRRRGRPFRVGKWMTRFAQLMGWVKTRRGTITVAVVLGAFRFEESRIERHRSLEFSLAGAIVVTSYLLGLLIWARRAARQAPNKNESGDELT